MRGSRVTVVLSSFLIALAGPRLPQAWAATVAVGGASHVLVVKTTDGTLWSWGNNGLGQLGDGTNSGRWVPTQITALTGVVGVAAGYEHSLAIKSDGTLWAWGANSYGQLGTGNTTARNTPIQVLTGVAAVAAGQNHSVALKQDGTVWTWGRNESGQLGDGGTTSRSTPAQVTGLGAVSAIAAGVSHTMAVQAGSGTLKAWGRNASGELGIGNTNASYTPVTVSGLGSIVDPVAGGYTSGARTAAGVIYVWGQNTYGNLGLGDTTNRTSPVQSPLGGVAALTDGYNHALAILADGSLDAWGYNLDGQVGDGTKTNRTSPVALVLPTSVVATAAGLSSSIAVTSIGEVWTWGNNQAGAIGDGTTETRTVPTQVAGAGFNWKVSTPTMNYLPGVYTNALNVTISCNTAGATIRYSTDGTDPTASSTLYTAPVSVAASTTLKARAFLAGRPDSNVAGGLYALQVVSPSFSPGGGTYTTPQNVTLSTTTPSATIQYTLDGSTPTAASPAYSAPLSIATWTVVSAVATKSGWTDSAVQSRTYAMNFGTLAPPAITPAAGTYVDPVVVSMSASPGATIRYTTNGSDPTASSTVYAAPVTLGGTTTLRAKAFQLDYTASSTTTAAYTVQVAAPAFSKVAGTYPAGESVVITCPSAGSTLYYTINGADPTTTDTQLPCGGSLVLGNYTLKAIALRAGSATSAIVAAAFVVSGPLAAPAACGGLYHSLALRADGTVWAWGYGGAGQTGDGTNGHWVPGRVSGLTGVVEIASGSSHGLARLSDGSVWSWGGNGSGQLGDGSTANRFRPVLVAGLSGASTLAAGGAHSLALRSDGVVWAWGSNTSGQIGDGTTTQRNTPVQVSGLAGTIAIASGASHSLALKSDGTVWAWGYNSDGQLGDGTTTARSTPVQVVALGGVVRIAGGVAHSLAVKADGTVWAWGKNANGQLGDGSTAPRVAPVQVQTAGNFARVASAPGASHSVGLRSDGTVWTWGLNASGQLGDGTNNQRITPVQVALTSVSAIGAGDARSLAILSDGSLWVWGDNLGDGRSTATSNIPVKIADAGGVFKAGTPTFSLNPGTYQAEQSLSIRSETSGTSIYYTFDGSEPTAGSSLYTGPLSITQTTTVRAMAAKAGWGDSNTSAVTITLQVPQVSLTPGQGTYNSDQPVTVGCSVSGTTVRYTKNGADPTPSDPTVACGGTILVDQPMTVKAVGWRTGWLPSTLKSALYIMVVGTPTFSPPGGFYSAAQSVTLSTVTSGATINYSTNGADPSTFGTAVAPGTVVTIPGTLTLKASASRPGWTTSGVSSATYALTLPAIAAPTLSPPGGAYSAPQAVTISAPAGAMVRYTLDGTDPTAASAAYVAPLAIALTTTVKAQAFANDRMPSAVSSATYSLDGAAVATPTLVPLGGSYAKGVSVTAASSTAGATIHYTTNGLDPVASDPSIASGGMLTVDRDMRVKVKAFKTGLAESGVRTADYWVTGAVAAGERHSLLLKSDGSVWSWGSNTRGQLGDGTTMQRLSPVPVPALSNVVAVAAGSAHSLALKADGTVWAWGYNLSGEVGDGTTTQRPSPVQVTALTGVVAIAAGNSGASSYALKSDGTVWAWGSNSNGQLGDGTNVSRSAPVRVGSLAGVAAIAAGDVAALAVDSDGAAAGPVWAWGGNGGRLGDGTNTDRWSPVLISDIRDAVSVGSGKGSSYAIRPGGEVWSWGANGSRQLADGTTTNRLSPVSTSLANITTVAALQTGAVGLRTDGRLLRWGFGDTTALVATGSQLFVGIGGGGSHVVVLGRDGSVWAWGANDSGQIGDGTTTTRNTPVRLTGLSAADESWLSQDGDSDGLPDADEARYGCSPALADTNLDGVTDKVAVAAGLSCSDLDMDGDSESNAAERAMGTDPFRIDTDGDGVSDATDCFPLDPSRSVCPVPTPGDVTPPTLTLTEPSSAVLVGATPP